LCKLGVLIASQEVEENIGAKDDISSTSRALKRVVREIGVECGKINFLFRFNGKVFWN